MREKGAEPQRSELRIVPAARTTAPWAELAVCAHGPNTVEAWTHRPTVGMPDRCILRESMRPVRAPVSALEATARLLRSDQPARRQDRLFWAPLAAPDRFASCSIMSVFRLDCGADARRVRRGERSFPAVRMAAQTARRWPEFGGTGSALYSPCLGRGLLPITGRRSNAPCHLPTAVASPGDRACSGSSRQRHSHPPDR